ncbi:hypothetical protein [Paenibacillus polysaccharolyticus]|uniref:hypothetical protein n=1 Tax=Paenibacillus polysaccharolyticus TaxID=582692 RepID=UPI003008F19E
MNNTRNIKRFWLVMGTVVAALALYFVYMNNRFVDIETPLSSAEVVRADTSKAIYTKGGGGVQIRFDAAVLNETETSRVVNWLNEAPASAKTAVDRIEGSVHMGIALKLKYNTQVTIQYNGKEIYVTKNSRLNQDSRYILHHQALKDYLDQELEGTYYGGNLAKEEQGET